MSEEFKAKLISFNESAYNKARIKFESYQIKYQESQKRLESILELDLKEVDLSKESAFKTIAKMYAEKFKDANSLGLTGIRLMELRDIPLKELMKSLDLLRVSKIDEPIKEDFKVYTTNESQNERLATAKEFIAVLKKINTNVQFESPINAPIRMIGNQIEPNQYWIKGLR